MALTFDGFTISGGITPIYGTTGSSRGTIKGKKCSIANQSGIGASFDPFSFEIECDCEPQAGDTIEVIARTILFIDITTIKWSLCGGSCSGESTGPGFSFGLEIKKLKWRVN